LSCSFGTIMINSQLSQGILFSDQHMRGGDETNFKGFQHILTIF
jgi:hypothetical protein